MSPDSPPGSPARGATGRAAARSPRLLLGAAEDFLSLLFDLAEQLSRGGRPAAPEEGLAQVPAASRRVAGVFRDERIIPGPAACISSRASRRAGSALARPAEFDLDAAGVEQGQGQSVAKLARP